MFKSNTAHSIAKVGLFVNSAPTAAGVATNVRTKLIVICFLCLFIAQVYQHVCPHFRFDHRPVIFLVSVLMHYPRLSQKLHYHWLFLRNQPYGNISLVTNVENLQFWFGETQCFVFVVSYRCFVSFCRFLSLCPLSPPVCFCSFDVVY